MALTHDDRLTIGPVRVRRGRYVVLSLIFLGGLVFTGIRRWVRAGQRHSEIDEW
jgi:hypothetical protein